MSGMVDTVAAEVELILGVKIPLLLHQDNPKGVHLRLRCTPDTPNVSNVRGLIGPHPGSPL